MGAAPEFLEVDDHEPPPPEGWRTAFARICIARNSASVREVVADMAARDLYPTDRIVAVTLSVMARNGFLWLEKRNTCAACHHPRTLYHITAEGRITYGETA